MKQKRSKSIKCVYWLLFLSYVWIAIVDRKHGTDYMEKEIMFGCSDQGTYKLFAVSSEHKIIPHYVCSVWLFIWNTFLRMLSIFKVLSCSVHLVTVVWFHSSWQADGVKCILTLAYSLTHSVSKFHDCLCLYFQLSDVYWWSEIKVGTGIFLVLFG